MPWPGCRFACPDCLPSVLPIKWPTIVYTHTHKHTITHVLSWSFRTLIEKRLSLLKHRDRQTDGRTEGCVFAGEPDRSSVSQFVTSVSHVVSVAVLSVECCSVCGSHLYHNHHPPGYQPPWGTSLQASISCLRNCLFVWRTLAHHTLTVRFYLADRNHVPRGANLSFSFSLHTEQSSLFFSSDCIFTLWLRAHI